MQILHKYSAIKVPLLTLVMDEKTELNKLTEIA